MDSPVVPLDVLFTSARVFLAIVFLIAGIPKLVAGKDLSETIRSLGVERREFIFALRLAVPVVETALGVWLLVDWQPAAAAFSAAAMFGAFTFALVRLRARGAGGCACFIWDDGSVGVGHLIRNLVLVTVAAVTGIATLLRWYVWEPVWKLPAAPALTVGASVAFVFLLYALIATSLQFARTVAADR